MISDYPHELDLSMLAFGVAKRAIKAFEEGDAKQFVGCRRSAEQTLTIALMNKCLLRTRGIYEAALIHCLTDCKANNSEWSVAALRRIFDQEDRKKLRAAGQKLPSPGPFTLYRGVAGNGPKRRIAGLSWTDSLDIACWFALRLSHLKHPAVYTACVPTRRIYCFTNTRGEREFICAPTRWKRVRLSLEEMQQGRLRYNSVLDQFARDRPARLQAQWDAMHGRTPTVAGLQPTN